MDKNLIREGVEYLRNSDLKPETSDFGDVFHKILLFLGQKFYDEIMEMSTEFHNNTK